VRNPAQSRTPDTQLFRDVFDASPIGIAVENLQGQPLFVNPAFCSFLGFSEEEMRRKRCVDFSPREDAEKDWELFQKLKEGLIDHYQLDKRYFRRDGSLIWGRLSLSLLNSRSAPLVLAMVEDITEQKRAAEALRSSEERLRLAQQAARIGTFEWNFEGGVNAWTPELEALYGLPRGGFGGTQTAFENLVYTDDRAGVVALNNWALKTGLPTQGEWRAVWPDGSVHWIAGRWQALMNESGKPSRMLGINVDVTERKRAEERLREYEKAVEGAEDIIGVVDREYRLLLANRQYLKMRSMTREQVVGHLLPDVLNQEIFETVIKPKLDECFKGKVVKYERKFSFPEVGKRDLLLSYFPIEGTDGTIDRAACILHDITDRKRAEEALIELNRTLEVQSALLQSSEELLKTFVKNVPAAVAMLDRNMRYLQVSDRWCSDYLPGRAQILGRLHHEIFPDMPERWKEIHRRCLAGETLRADEDRWEGQDGPHWARWEVRPWKTAEGTVGGILILAEDITRRKLMEEALSTMSRKLIDSQEQERVRIARELHDDIGQRLSLLAIELDRLRLSEKLPPEVFGDVSELLRQATSLTADVQTMSHNLHSARLEILGLASAIKSTCHDFAQQHDIEIDFESHGLYLPLPSDVSLALFRVLQEALRNASKHSGVKHVQVRLHEADGEIHLLVRDSGRGFDLNSAIQGRGLGLTSMQERVRLVNGKVTIDSKPMRGTSVHVSVPLPLGHEEQRTAG